MTAVVTARRSDGTPLPVQFGYVSFRHSAGAAKRIALAYSNLRLLWWPLAYAELPMLWVLLGVGVALRPHQLVGVGGAVAMRPVRPGSHAPRRPAWMLLITQLAVLLVVAGLPVLIIAAADTWTQIYAGEAILGVLWFPVLTFGLAATVQHITGRGLRPVKKHAQAQTGRTPVVATTLAAWPCTGSFRRGRGDDFALIRAAAADCRAHGEVLVGLARTRRLAERYVRRTGACRYQPNPGQQSTSRRLYWP